MWAREGTQCKHEIFYKYGAVWFTWCRHGKIDWKSKWSRSLCIRTPEHDRVTRKTGGRDVKEMLSKKYIYISITQKKVFILTGMFINCSGSVLLTGTIPFRSRSCRLYCFTSLSTLSVYQCVYDVLYTFRCAPKNIKLRCTQKKSITWWWSSSTCLLLLPIMLCLHQFELFKISLKIEGKKIFRMIERWRGALFPSWHSIVQARKDLLL